MTDLSDCNEKKQEATGAGLASGPRQPAEPDTTRRPQRRHAVTLAALLTLLLPWLLFGHGARLRLPSCLRHERPLSLDRRVDLILSNPETPLIDGHIDLPLLIRYKYGNRLSGEFADKFASGLYGHVDILRLEAGRVGGAFWSVYVQCPAAAPNNFSDAVYYESVHDTLQQIDVVRRLAAAFPDTLALATSPAEAVAARKAGKIASFLGAEGLHQIGNSAATLRLYYDMGVRYVTLSHVCNNKYTDGATAPGGEFWGGLSQDGVKMVTEMNRIGMLVDLSHVTANAMREALSVTKAPVIYSHSSAYALCPHDRNVPDDVLHMVKANGGVVMVNFYSRFVSCGSGKKPEDATLATVADHLEHIGNLIGWDHVGIGSDYDGIDLAPEGLEDVSKYPELFKEMLRRGLSDEDAGKVAGGNLLRVWRQVEKVSEQMKAEGIEPLEDDIETPSLALALAIA